MKFCFGPQSPRCWLTDALLPRDAVIFSAGRQTAGELSLWGVNAVFVMFGLFALMVAVVVASHKYGPPILAMTHLQSMSASPPNATDCCAAAI